MSQIVHELYGFVSVFGLILMGYASLAILTITLVSCWHVNLTRVTIVIVFNFNEAT